MLEQLRAIRISEPFINAYKASTNLIKTNQIAVLNQSISIALFEIIWTGFLTIRKNYTTPLSPAIELLQGAKQFFQPVKHVIWSYPLPLHDYQFTFNINDFLMKQRNTDNNINYTTFIYCLDALNCGTNIVGPDRTFKVPPELFQLIRECPPEDKNDFMNRILITNNISGTTLEPRPLKIPLKSPAPYRYNRGVMELYISPVQYSFTVEPEITPHISIELNINWRQNISEHHLKTINFWDDLETSIAQEIGEKPQITKDDLHPDNATSLSVTVSKKVDIDTINEHLRAIDFNSLEIKTSYPRTEKQIISALEKRFQGKKVTEERLRELEKIVQDGDWTDEEKAGIFGKSREWYTKQRIRFLGKKKH